MGSLATVEQQIAATSLDPSPVPPSVVRRFLGRQPILDKNLNLYGYELLFRASAESTAFSGDPEAATRCVTDNYLLMIPEANRSTAFINCTREVLVRGLATLLPPHNTVLEILENIDPDEEVLASCADLKRSGYRFALDDFSPDASKYAFLPFADFIKVDFRASGVEERNKIYALAAQYGAKLIAEKVETAEDMELARAEGCELFQGYFFSKPMIVAQRAVPRNHLTYLRLLAVLCRTPTNINEVEMLIKSELSLCYELLRLVNSALYGLNVRVASIRNALLLVGDDEIRKLVSVALAGVFAESHSRTLISMALERAKFCESLAPFLKEDPSKLYLLGMLSLIDAIVQIPMTQIMKSLPIEVDMVAALIGQDSPLRVTLDLARCYEAGNWQGCETHQQVLGLSECTASIMYMESLHWADSVMEQLSIGN